MRDSDWSRPNLLRSDWLGHIGAIMTTYEENVRTLKQTQGTPWDQIHAELWLRSHYFRPKLSTQPGKSKKHGHLSQGNFVGSFTGGLHVLDAFTNTSVSGVGKTTQFPNAYKPPHSLLEILGPKQHLLPARALPIAPLLSETLPFPVKARS